jgi:acetyltransferase-like isoleucine patch superfamily enzyme
MGRVLMLGVLYPGFSADRRTFIGPGCDILCSNESRIRLSRAHISRGVLLHADNGGAIEITDSFVGRYSTIASQSRVSIGPGAALAEGVTVRDQDHVVDPTIPLTESGAWTAPVEIGRGCWVGAKASVLKGVTVGDHATIGAGAVVTSHVGAGEVQGGIPARLIRRRAD